MQKESEVRKKLRDLRYRYLARYLDERLSVRPCNCVHNHEHIKGDGPLRLCMLGADDPENWPGNICDTDENAQTCPFFDNRHDKAALKSEFDKQLQDPEILFTEYRDVAMLQWVLDEAPEEITTELSWWQRVKLWFTRG